MNDFFTKDDLEDESVYFKCQNHFCQQYFQPALNVRQRKKIILSEGEKVTVDSAQFTCPTCGSSYNGVALSKVLQSGNEIVIMFLQKPQIRKIGSATVAS